ncbi:hypothetical protein CPB84DRAFT_1798041 [Gymnopilus junonius]|uniref:Zn(2)-C6 fungal-type domain-containing protein n=1 Tax=Gymnopilus junonius TaxID=109634 RepID=A0A9P5TFC2_GYMJU|nr:hypothetical protein CPB84DRAFT_1798041 [Gymnopilus junonius]
MHSTGNDERSSNQGYLPRGAACVSCRRRKMKCDGKRPVCSQCDRAGRAEDCEYMTGQERSTVQILEDNISRLEARIQELQNPATPAAAVKLHQPYTGGPSSAQQPPVPSPSRTPPIQDPPRHIAENLMSTFLAHAAQVGFFLNVPRFQASFFINQPTGRPSPALISSAYLWAIRFSHDPSVKVHEAAYLDRATQDAATALSGTHPERIMHTIQAEVLLANYFFASGRFFEGKYHVTTAISMVFSAGLHRIRSATPQQSQTSADNRLSAPRDPTEEGERILALWTVLNLDKTWAIALEERPNFEYSSHALATKIDTPWPLEMEDFEQGRLPPQARTSNTIQNFLNGVATPDLGVSLSAIEAKTAVLWERVATFTRKYQPDSSPETMQTLLQEFNNLTSVLESVLRHLPSPDPQALVRVQDVQKARRAGVVYSMLCAAIIRLNVPLASTGSNAAAKRKMLATARTILEIVLALRSRGPAYLDPIIGTVWIEASQVVFDEVAFIRSARASGSLPAGSADDRAMLSLVQQATSAMSDFSDNIPLTSFQVSKIRETGQSL